MRLQPSQRSWAILLVAAGTLVGVLRSQPGKEAVPNCLPALIEQLGTRSFARREAASRALEAVGEKALPALRAAADIHADLEVRQRAWRVVRTILLGCRKSKGIGLELALIDADSFQMGSPRTEANRRADENEHRVRITRPYLLGVYEVTQEEYRKVMKSSPSWFAPTGAGKDKVMGLDTTRFPVENLTWFDAVEFCNLLSKLDGYEPYCKLAEVKREGDSIKSATVTLAGGNGYRLPTEAEWEFACRAWSNRPYHFGYSNTGREANLRPGPAIGYGAAPTWPTLGRTTKVGSYAPNLKGLYDMHGNAAEWCWDWYDHDYYANSPQDDPKGPERGYHRVLRGGSWLVNEGSCRSANRHSHPPADTFYYAGFRVARTP